MATMTAEVMVTIKDPTGLIAIGEIIANMIKASPDTEDCVVSKEFLLLINKTIRDAVDIKTAK